PKDIVVQRITLGNTQLIVDGQTAGMLGPGSSLGELTGDRLRIYLHGALTLGAHTLQLASQAADGPRFSAELTMIVTAPATLPPRTASDAAPATLPPRVGAVLDPDPRDTGDALTPSGSRSDALLGVLAAGSPPTLRLYRALDAAWPAVPLVETPLTGHVSKAMSFGAGVTALALSPARDSDAVVLRVAYPRGLPGDAIVTRDLTLAPEPAVGPLQTAVD